MNQSFSFDEIYWPECNIGTPEITSTDLVIPIRHVEVIKGRCPAIEVTEQYIIDKVLLRFHHVTQSVRTITKYVGNPSQ